MLQSKIRFSRTQINIPLLLPLWSRLWDSEREAVNKCLIHENIFNLRYEITTVLVSKNYTVEFMTILLKFCSVGLLYLWPILQENSLKYRHYYINMIKLVMLTDD